jgi:hypothetical protein
MKPSIEMVLHVDLADRPAELGLQLAPQQDMVQQKLIFLLGNLHEIPIECSIDAKEKWSEGVLLDATGDLRSELCSTRQCPPRPAFS